MVLVYWVLTGLCLGLGLISLFRHARLLAYAKARLAAAPDLPEYPPATVIVPVKGHDDGLKENLASLASMDYPDYELIVVARSPGDLPEGVIPSRARVIFAGEGNPNNGEKVNNLLAAVRQVRQESTVLAFADSDGMASRGWLRALLAPLGEAGVGASTGYRFHLPLKGGMWALLRSVWNAAVYSTFTPHASPFAWGGAMAIRREVFDRAGVIRHWQGTVSDDYGLSAAVREAGLRIVWAPGATVRSLDGTSRGEFLRWIVRQMVISRVYHPPLWRVALAAHLLYCLVMAASAVLAVTGVTAGILGTVPIPPGTVPIMPPSGVVPFALALGAQLGLSFASGAFRLRLGRILAPESKGWFARYGWVHVWLTPVGSWLWLYSLLCSAQTRIIDWRGHRYRISAGETRRL